MRKLKTIMLIDDDSITNFLNELLFKEMDLADEMIIATNGQEALHILSARGIGEGRCPELILLDINMPVMNGFEFLEKFNKLDFDKRQSLIIIMLTTSLNPTDREKAKELSVTDYLGKPLTKIGLKEIMEKYF